MLYEALLKNSPVKAEGAVLWGRPAAGRRLATGFRSAYAVLAKNIGYSFSERTLRKHIACLEETGVVRVDRTGPAVERIVLTRKLDAPAARQLQPAVVPAPPPSAKVYPPSASKPRWRIVFYDELGVRRERTAHTREDAERIATSVESSIDRPWIERLLVAIERDETLRQRFVALVTNSG